MYLHQTQTLDKLKRFRAKDGVQSYPSRTKDGLLVDISTGSVGLGASFTTFAAWVQHYLIEKGEQMRPKNMPPSAHNGRMISIVGDAELDEVNY